jgi:ADP-ribose pyrophosphatase
MRAKPPTEATLLTRRTVHHGRVVEVGVDRVRLPNGVEVDLDMVRHPGAAAVLPFVDADTVLMVRQFRWATGGYILEVPAGKLDQAGEDPAACAARELAEEAGCAAGRLEPLGFIWTAPGFTDEKIHLFQAFDLTPVPQALDQDEVLEVVRLPFRRVLEMAAAGEIPDAKTLAALFQAQLRRGRQP